MTDKGDAIPAERFFRHAEEGGGPWEINRPQPVIMTLVEKGLFNGELLDIGCGIADNAICIAKHANNVHVTGFDLVCAPSLFFLHHNKSV
jgi:2-polyprenyl-3-methyl-5-hydroxy-6-metoxy-1,4-benzoquinol methylase